MQVWASTAPVRRVALRLDPGEDLFGSLTEVTRSQDIRAGFVVSALGALRDAEVGYFAGEGYRKRVLPGDHELLGMPGSFARLDGAPHLHLHASLAGPDHRVLGGHLHAAKVGFLVEALIDVLPAEFGRTPHGPLLRLLSFPPGTPK